MNDNKSHKLQFYVTKGWPIFPITWMINGQCSCGKPECNSKGKHPLVKEGFYAASKDVNLIYQWYERWPDANWGMRTGDAKTGGAGIIVIDIDSKSGGFETWEMLREENPELIETVTVETGGGGQHLWFIYPPGVDIHSSAGLLGPGIDIRANNGYVLIPPSRTSQDYRFLLNPTDTPIDSCPEWILAKLNGKVLTGQLPASHSTKMEVPQGARHQSLLTMAGSMWRIGMTSDEIMSSLITVRKSRFEAGDHNVTDDEITDVVDWISHKQHSYALTDLGNAERFVDLFGYWVKYCYEWEEWLVWDKHRWVVNASAEIMQMAHDTVRSILLEASQTLDNYQRKIIVKHAISSQAHPKVMNMLHSAKPYLTVRTDQLDRHTMLLNVANGVIDLATGLILPHDPNYLFTKIIDVAYDPNAKCPEWDKFLDLVTGGDKDLQSFLQMAVGYTLTGSTDEHCLFILYGIGSNGKTTFTETLRLLFGDFAHRVNIESLMQSRIGGQTATPDVADMAGKRYVLSSEIPDNRKLNEALVKDLTGGDAITARKLFSNPFTFLPNHKLWIYGNHKPRITGTDEGIWRRIRVIPFNITIPKELRRKMSDILQIFQKEMPGILAWAVTGCILWQVNRFLSVEAVNTATSEYRNDQDLVQQFLEEKCEMHVSYSVDKDTLYRAWREWCEAAGEKDAMNRSKKWLTRQMSDRGFKHGGAQDRFLVGVQIKK